MGDHEATPEYAYHLLKEVDYLHQHWKFRITPRTLGWKRLPARLKGEEIPLSARFFP
jgi:hypothetical protein